MIYFDNSSTTKICPESLEITFNTLKNNFGNSSSLHNLGLESENIVIAAQKKIAKALNCDYKQLFFTSGATESNNNAIFGLIDANKRIGNEIITTSVEHMSVLNPIKQLENKDYKVTYINSDSKGQFQVLDFVNAVTDKTILVSLMLVNNELGTILPVEQIVKQVKRKNPNVLIHIDATQGFLKFPINLRLMDIDCLSFSGHKIFAPKGIGVLYIKKGTKLTPLLFGASQQNGVRSGTVPVPLIAGLGQAVEFINNNFSKHNQNYKELNDCLLNGLKNIDCININSPDENKVNHITNFSVDKIPSEVMLHFLESHNIFVSSGSACSKGKRSHVLENSQHINNDNINYSLRISFGYYNTKKEVEEFLEKLKIGINRLIKVK